ncbi:MAG TPA: hypothetical protein VIG90_04225 [Pedomonas sp.]|uniref:hypothetical protein n=1 Tax=Pedomonas sp. TaxID=2976421 RepID=UPI002F3E884E
MPGHQEPGFDVICDDCGHKFFQPIARLDTKTLDPCPACGADGHFEPEQWQALEAGYAEATRRIVEAFDQIKLPKGWRKR